MDERVRQHFAQSLVDRCIIIPRHVVRRNLERHLHPRRDRLVDAEEEVEDVSAPVGIARTHAIRPADVWREVLAVVEEEVRQDVCNLIEVTEADKPSKRRMHLAVVPASRRADLHQEAVIGQPAPDMSRAQLAEVHPIPADGIGVKVGNRQFVKDAVVRCLRALVADHALDSLPRAMVVTLAVSAVRSLEHVRANKDRADSALRSRDFDNNKPFAVNLDGINRLVEQDIRTDLLGVVDRVPDVGHRFLYIRQSLDLALAVLFADAKDDGSAVRVGERAVRWPEVGGNAAFRPLELDGGILALFHKFLDLFRFHLNPS